MFKSVRYPIEQKAFPDTEFPIIKPKIGGFVRVEDNYGIGKLLEIVGNQGRIRFWHSTTKIEERLYPLTKLNRALLYPQTRVYSFNKQLGRWRAGRVVGYQQTSVGLEYTIQFPNKHVEEIPELELDTRSFLPNQDPAEALACGWFETQFFHDRRLAALKALITARANSCGVTGLLSASVELLPHQVNIVQRILSDPIQRYLLTDEVGLGKTIEAGAIVRQWLLDDPISEVVILTPFSLKSQWDEELEEKFGIDEFNGRVKVISFDSLKDLIPGKVDTLIIDEAHHLITSDQTLTTCSENDTYNKLAQIAHSCKRLLLLTATPILGNEQATLGLLHLLDPYTYHLEDHDGLHRKLVKRQEYGKLLMALSPTTKPFILKRIGAQILETFPNDSVVADLVPKISDTAAGLEEISYNVRVLKKYIAETYRLHQRLLRTRRKDLEGWEMQPRQGKIKLLIDKDIDYDRLWGLLEDWRYRSLITPKVFDETSLSRLKPILAHRYLNLFEALGRGVEEFKTELNCQRNDVLSGRLASFEDEEEVFQSFISVLKNDNNSQKRSLFLKRVIHETFNEVDHPITGSPKVVAFTSSETIARYLAAILEESMGADSISLVVQSSGTNAIDIAVKKFQHGSKPMVLICDITGEEGLNLPFTDAIVHLDIPLDPARLEQRIGRVDRIGRSETSIRHVIVLNSDNEESPCVTWYKLLKEGFQIFDNPISEVQFILERVQEHLVLSLYEGGSVGLTNAIDWVRAELERERTKLDEQYALDCLATLEDNQSIFEKFEKSDDKTAYNQLDSWLVGTLGLKREYDRRVQAIFRLYWKDYTLMPKDPWQVIFRPALNKELSYDRVSAVRHAGVRLIRPGSMLVEAVEQLLSWDDRGTSFATWRVDSRWKSDEYGEWIGFRLVYIVESDIQLLGNQLANKVYDEILPAIKRRIDALFQPWIEVLTLDSTLNEINDVQVLTILERPYNKSKQQIEGRDYNLDGYRESLSSLITPHHFNELCIQVRQISEELIRKSDKFTQSVDTAVQKVRDDLEIRNRYLTHRNTMLQQTEGSNDPMIEKEISINEAIMEIVKTPCIRLDAIGFYVISDQPPSQDNDEQE